jgi:CO dehydrogenase maturation factor
MIQGNDDYGAKVLNETAHITRIVRAGAKTGRVLMVTGRGGTGKSTFSALASRFLKPPLLLCDIDPDQSLGAMLGIDIEKTQVTTEIGRDAPLKTLSELSTDIEDEDALLELGGGDLTVKIPMLLQWYAQYRSEKFDLISLGPKWTEGDYRSANFLFEFIVPNIGKNYAHIVIDSPAGLEHLNRRVVGKVDDLFLVVDPSAKSLKHIERVRRITGTVGIRYQNLYVVGNHEFDSAAIAQFKQSGQELLGVMAPDPRVREYNLKGASLWDIPADSPACASVKTVLAAAAYEVVP